MDKKIIATGFSKSKKLPEGKESLDKKLGIQKWGTDNQYPFHIVDAYNGSAWHQGIIKTKTYYVAGGGLEIISGQLESFLENEHSDYTIDEMMKKVAFDFELFDGFCIVGSWNRDGTKVVRWEHFDIDRVRTNIDQSKYFFSDNWASKKQTKEDTNFREILPLDLEKKEGKFVIYYKSPSKQTKGDMGTYPKPSYIGGMTDINADVLISKYHYYEISNGFKVGTLVNFASGTPETDEEAEEYRDQVKGTSTAIEDVNEVIITFSDGQENAPTVLSLNGNDLADRYNLTEKSIQQNILVAHSATNPMLFGIKTEGQLGGATELLESFEIFKSIYVNGRQQSLLWAIDLMIKLSGEVGEVDFIQAMPMAIIEEAIEETIVTEDGEEAIPVEEAENVAGSAMNGAQISSLVGIVEAVGLNTLTPDSAVQVILASFPTISEAQAREIVGVKDEPTTFRSEEADLKVFKKFGQSRDEFKVVKSISVSNDFGSKQVAQFEADNFSTFFDKIDDIRNGMTDIDKNVLSMLKSGEDAPDMAKAIDAPMKDIAKSMDKLGTLNLIVDGETSKLGEQVLEGLDVEIEQFEIRYSYEVKVGMGEPKIPGTRNFCRTLIDIDRMYLRSDIDTITNAIGRDVWRYRGGFYNNGTATTPWCRHEWKQHLVIKKTQ
jgi:hypothetical protein